MSGRPSSSDLLLAVIEELLKLALRPELATLVLFGRLNVRVFWALGAGLLLLGLLLDVLTLVCSLFFRRVTMALLAVALLVHTVGVIPQQVTSECARRSPTLSLALAGVAMAVKLDAAAVRGVEFHAHFEALERACRQNDGAALRAAKPLVDDIQTALMCCGWKRPLEWEADYCAQKNQPGVSPLHSLNHSPLLQTGDTPWWAAAPGEHTPRSCCVRPNGQQTDEPCDPGRGERLATDGCERAADGLIRRVLLVGGPLPLTRHSFRCSGS